MEIWKDIEGYEGYYQVSNMGSVQSLNRTCTNKNNKIMTFKGKILKPQNDRCGYLCVLLSLNGIKRNFKIHRLVAQAFIDNSNNKPCVNHKDGNKTNNMVYNLEWCTQQENIHHYYNSDAKKKPREMRPILAWDIPTGKFLGEFPSISHAARELNCGPETPWRQLTGLIKNPRRYKFEYKDNE